MLVRIILLVALMPVVFGITYFVINTHTPPFENICVPHHQKYTDECSNVGKRAHSLKSISALTDKDYGPIAGIAWRTKGSIISSPGREKRYAESDAYYYIIGSDKSDYIFLRLTTQVDPR